MTFNQKLNQIIEKKRHFLCIGLDPDPDKMPGHLRNDPNRIAIFTARIIEKTKHLAVAYKPNMAFFESEGISGLQALQDLKKLIPPDVLLILDGKRGDIGNTARKYAHSAFKTLGADAVTVNAYMGFDAVLPFVEDPQRGAFVLALTSNPSAAELQNLKSDGKEIYMHLAQLAEKWNTKNNCGLVVGATKPQGLKEIRNLCPTMPFLVPGVGAQGGDLEKVLQFGRNTQGTGLLINVGRDILYAGNSVDFDSEAEQKAEQYVQMMTKLW